MRTGKQLILATKPYAQDVTWKSWYHTITTAIILAGLLTAIYFNDTLPIFRTACSIMCGLVIVRMFVIYHDHQHHAILNRSVPANILFTLFGIFVLAPTSIWKRSHDHHHNHNSKLFSASIGSYPIMTKQKFEESTAAEQRTYLAIRHPLTILFGYLSMFVYGMCIRSFLCSPLKHWDSAVALVLHIGVGVLIFINLGWAGWFLLQFLPFFIAMAIGSYLFYAQHNFPGVTFTDKEGWCHDNAAMASSSYMLMSPFWKWVTGNIGYHHIHHLNSRVPFYRLPEAMEHIPELQQAKTTSLHPLEIWACLKLKIWHPERNEMVPVPVYNNNTAKANPVTTK